MTSSVDNYTSPSIDQEYPEQVKAGINSLQEVLNQQQPSNRRAFALCAVYFFNGYLTGLVDSPAELTPVKPVLLATPPQAEPVLSKPTPIVPTPVQPSPLDTMSLSSSQQSPKKKKIKQTNEIISRPFSSEDVTGFGTASKVIVSDSRKSDYGFRSRAEFARDYRKVYDKVNDHIAKKLGSVLYPSICNNQECSLCISWYCCTSITPCHPKYCDGSCKFGYNAHTSKYGLRLLRKYHSRIQSFPIHVNSNQTIGPEFESAVCHHPNFPKVVDGLSLRIKTIVKLSSDMTAVARFTKAPANDEDTSSSDGEADGSSIPFVIKRKRNALSHKGQ